MQTKVYIVHTSSEMFTFALSGGGGGGVGVPGIQIQETHILTSHDFSWLQKGQLNMVSKAWMIFLFGGGLLAFFLLPMAELNKKPNIIL